MGLDLFSSPGAPLDRQGYDWCEVAGLTVRTFEDDALTRPTTARTAIFGTPLTGTRRRRSRA